MFYYGFKAFRTKEKLHGKKIKRLIRLSPFFVVVFIIPLIRFHIPIRHNREIGQVLLQTQWYDDYFCLIKVCCLYLAVILATAVFILINKTKIQFPKAYYLLVPYTACILLSMTFSKHRVSAIFGIVDQYEGGLTLMLYLGILIFSYLLITEVSHIVTIIKIALSGSLIVSVVGILEFTGIIEIDPSYAVSSTIGNSNYVGTYAVLLLPLSVALVFLETNRTKKLFYLLVSYGSVFFLLAGSLSRAGYLGILAITPVGFVLLWEKIRVRLKWIIYVVIYSFFILFLMNTFSKGFLFDEIKSLNPFYEERQEDKIRFEDITITGKTAEIKTDRWILKVSDKNGRFSFSDEKGKLLLHSNNTDTQAIEFIEEPYRGITGHEYCENEVAWLMLKVNDKAIEFVTNKGRLQVVGYNGKLTDILKAENFGFNNRESFASGRGYIWSRTFPLLKNALLIGYGPDTFIYLFPQNDIVGKMNYGAIWTIISKPHSWYLQTAFGTGVLSLLCLLAFIIWYVAIAFGKTTKRLPAKDLFFAPDINAKNDQKQIISITILTSVLGYCIVGVFNDSTVAVSPIFWMLLGFGIRLVR